MRRSAFLVIAWALVASFARDNYQDQDMNKDKDPDLPKDVFENSREFPEKSSRFLRKKNLPKEAFESSRKFHGRSFQNKILKNNVPNEVFENSREFFRRKFQILDGNVPKEVFDNSEKYPKSNFQTFEEVAPEEVFDDSREYPENNFQDVPEEVFDNSREYPEKDFQTPERNAPKGVFDNSREYPENNFETFEEDVIKDSSDKQRNLQEDHPIYNDWNKNNIARVKVVAKTGDVHRGGQEKSLAIIPELEIVLNNGMKYRAEMKGHKYKGEQYEIELCVLRDFTPSLTCTHQDIKEVYLKARDNDGWYVESITTYTVGEKKAYTELTTDPGFTMWVDANEESSYPYNAKKHLLSNAVPGSCITYIRVDALTGDKEGAGVSKGKKNHLIALILLNNTKHQAELEGPMEQNKPYIRELHFASRFKTTQCVSLSDIKDIHLQTQNEDTDGWYVASIRTSAKTGIKEYEDLTNDPRLEKFLDANEEYLYSYNAKDIKLTWVAQETLNCEYGNPTCECNPNVDVCTFNLEIDEIRTFTSYQKLSVDKPTGIAMRGSQGVIYYFGDDGTPTPLQTNRTCSTQDSAKCTYPQFVDGKTYRLAIAVNGQIPGPTLIAHEGQTLVIHVHNNLTIEGISIHWHGIHQKGTPWMDGVGQVTQCQIGPQTSFSYNYTTSPSGTFWYHSHSGAQRTDGFYGALIVKEKPIRMTRVKTELQKHGVDVAFEDLPDKHTLTLLDWQHEASLDLFTQVSAGLGFYPDKPIGEVPTSNDKKYEFTGSFEGGGVGPVPFFSGIINGKGRHVDVPYTKTRLSIFTVEAGKTYRFRLVGAQGLYAMRFSIDGHKLTVVSTDSYWLEPVKNVDYIIIHTGERYDFLLTATNKELNDYWMRAETLEINRSVAGPPYQSLGHVAEAILHYKQPGDSNDPDFNVPSSKYQEIKDRSPPIKCTQNAPCKAVNCPFKEFHSSYNINCVNVQSLRLLEPTPIDELPRANSESSCKDCRHFLNFNFEGGTETGAVNGRNLILPSFPPLTQNEQFIEKDIKCDLKADCNPSTLECSCVHVIDIPQGKTIQLVLTSIGAATSAHPIHLHGHTFHVVHVGYPEYNETTGWVGKHNSDIYCDDIRCTKEGCDKRRCTRPSWKKEPQNFSINKHTVRKDTVMVPAGGYVVINFLSNNPGYWFLHCHIEVHQLEGMAMIVNETGGQPMKPPAGINKCGDFELSVEKYRSYRSNM